MPEVNGVNIPFLPAGGIKELTRQQPAGATQSADKVSFRDVFQDEFDKLKFSKHAQSRMLSRNIDLSAGEFDRLTSAVNLAGQKGASDSLIMLDEKAFIVNVANKTVITVVSKDNLDSSVITDIDSAVFA
jgi:flagellar operon protein